MLFIQSFQWLINYLPMLKPVNYVAAFPPILTVNWKIYLSNNQSQICSLLGSGIVSISLKD